MILDRSFDLWRLMGVKRPLVPTSTNYVPAAVSAIGTPPAAVCTAQDEIAQGPVPAPSQEVQEPPANAQLDAAENDSATEPPEAHRESQQLWPSRQPWVSMKAMRV